LLAHFDVEGHSLYSYEKFVDICYNFVHGKNDSWNRHVPYISIEKLLKIKLIVVSCPFNQLSSMIRVEQLSVNTVMPKEDQFMKLLAHQNYQNQADVANFPIHFVLDVLGACNKSFIVHDL